MSLGKSPTATPTISVLLCVNRSNPYLAEAIRSVLNQEDGDFEFLIAANACSDDLMEELRRMVSGDPRARLLRTAIGQLAFNLNLLADHARGEYLVRMDSDDVCSPNRIARLRSSLAINPVDVLGSWAQVIDSEGRRIGEYRLPTEHQEIVKKLVYTTVFCHPAVAIRRQFLMDVRGYLGGFSSEDSDLWLRGLRRNPVYMNLPEFLLSYRVHGAQASRSRQGYAEMAAHWLRELLVAPSWYLTKGLVVALAKCLAAPALVAWHKTQPPRAAGGT